MSQSFFFPFFFFFFGFPLHTFSLINPIFSLSTHNLPIKQTAKVYTINDFPIESKLLSIQQSVILFLCLTYHLLIKKTAYLPIKTFNCRPLDLKPTDLIFYIQILKVYLRSPNYNQNQKVYLRSVFLFLFSLELLCFAAAIFMVCSLYCFFFLFFFFFFFFGFPLHTFSLINPIFSLSTHHLPIKQTAEVYAINEFPIESKLLSIQQSILLSLSLTYHLLIKKTAFLPIKTFNCLPLDLKPTDLVFYIQILKVYLRSPNYNQKSISSQFFFFFP